MSASGPVGCVDLIAFDQNGDAMEIHPCHVCSPWHAEVVVTELGEVLVREWHAVDRSVCQDLINDDSR